MHSLAGTGTITEVSSGYNIAGKGRWQGKTLQAGILTQALVGVGLPPLHGVDLAPRSFRGHNIRVVSPPPRPLHILPLPAKGVPGASFNGVGFKLFFYGKDNYCFVLYCVETLPGAGFEVV